MEDLSSCCSFDGGGGAVHEFVERPRPTDLPATSTSKVNDALVDHRYSSWLLRKKRVLYLITAVNPVHRLATDGLAHVCRHMLMFQEHRQQQSRTREGPLEVGIHVWAAEGREPCVNAQVAGTIVRGEWEISTGSCCFAWVKFWLYTCKE